MTPTQQLLDWHSSRIALVDCNSFYASCEQLVDKSLVDKPVAVLSLNDGCVIAANYEAKEMGVHIGMVYYKEKKRLEAMGVQVRSSNFRLYSKMSYRIMTILKEMAPDVEVYSIDEAWLDLSGFEKYYDLENFVYTIRHKILTETGIPVSIGIGTSKVTAKIANKRAKKKRTTFIEYLTLPCQREYLYRKISVTDLWGIANGIGERLSKLSVDTAYDYALLSDAQVDKLLGITGLRHVHALRGANAMPLSFSSEPRKTIICTRSFKYALIEKEDLYAAFAYYVERACEKLHRQNSVVGRLTVYLRTDRFNMQYGYYRGEEEFSLPAATAYPPRIFHYVRQIVDRLYRPGLRYKKGGIMLSDFQSDTCVQQNLFNYHPFEKELKLVKLVNQMNLDFFENQVDWAIFWSLRKNVKWEPKLESMSEAPTDDWQSRQLFSH